MDTQIGVLPLVHLLSCFANENPNEVLKSM